MDELVSPQRTRQQARPAVRNQTMKRPIHSYLILVFTAFTAMNLLPQSAFAQTPIVRIDAVAATPKNDFTPDTTRFGVPPFQAANSLVPHILNIQDCKAISAVQTGARVRFTWSWTNKALLNLSPTYGVKMSPPGTSCDSKTVTP